MSRYSVSLTKGRTLSYGLDHVCGYFADIFNSKGEPIVGVTGSFSLYPRCIEGGRGDVLEFLERHAAGLVPKAHLDAISLDFPIQGI